MINLNVFNGAAALLTYYQTLTVTRFEYSMIGVEMGIAYGGGVESLGSFWKGRGTVYGFDTFEGLHPDHLADDKYGFQARCMDHWYDKAVFGTATLSYDFQRKQLDAEQLSNVILVKGEVTKDSCKDLPYINYALLDMDIVASMKVGWEAIKDKLVPGAFVCLHDVVPSDHIPALYKWWYEEVMPNESTLKIVREWPFQLLLAVEKQ